MILYYLENRQAIRNQEMPNYTNETSIDSVEKENVYLFVAVCNILLACFTFPGNGLLLLALFKDPLGCFNTPTTLLVKSMTIANLITSLLVEPLTAASKISVLNKGKVSPVMKEITEFVTIIAPNASFLTVFALSLDSFVAVSRPLKYKVIVTKRNVFICMALIWGYITCFALLPFSGLSYNQHMEIDLYVNTTVTLMLLLASYFGLIKSLSTNRTRSLSLHTNNKDFYASSSRDLCLERSRRSLQAVVVLVLVLTLTIVPNMVSWMLYFHCGFCKNRPGFLVTIAALRYLAYLKFLCDPFVYAWRLPRYRRALKMVIFCRNTKPVGLENSRNATWNQS